MGKPNASPDRDRQLTLHDGRAIAHAEWGPIDGPPIVLLHGMPGSRLLCPDEDETRTAGVRLLTIDRPGWGRSTATPGRTLVSWVDDFVEWADLISLSPCPIIGWSSGGPYALACAARCADRVTKVGLTASVAPYDDVPGAWERMPDLVRELTREVRRDASAARASVELRCEWFVDGWEEMLEPDGDDADGVLLADAAVREAMRGLLEEAARQGSAGYVDDWIAESQPWEFSLRDVGQEALVWWGDDDRFVAREDSEHLAGTLPKAALHIFPGDGHLALIPRWGEVLAAMG